MAGLYLMLDGEIGHLLTIPQLAVLLPSLVQSIGMTPVGSPLLWDDPWGPSGYQGMKESHMAFDYINRTDVCIDLFSCRPFPIFQTAELLKKSFDIRKITLMKTVERGPSVEASGAPKKGHERPREYQNTVEGKEGSISEGPR